MRYNRYIGNRRSPFFRLIFLGIFIFAVIVFRLTYGIDYSPRHYTRNNLRGARAATYGYVDGKVLKFAYEYDYGDGTKVSSPKGVIQVEYTVNENTYTKVIFNEGKARKVGEIVTLRYDKGDPSRVDVSEKKVSNYNKDLMIKTIVYIGGFVLIVAALGYFIIRRR